MATVAQIYVGKNDELKNIVFKKLKSINYRLFRIPEDDEVWLRLYDENGGMYYTCKKKSADPSIPVVSVTDFLDDVWKPLVRLSSLKPGDKFVISGGIGVNRLVRMHHNLDNKRRFLYVGEDSIVYGSDDNIGVTRV